MKFATFTLSQVPDLERTVETLNDQFAGFLFAEELGFDTVWIAEHLFSGAGVIGSTQVLAAAIARATHKIRIGSAVNIIPFNHPLRTASDFAAIDCMSNGRLNYGTSRAYQPAEFASLGLDMSKSREMYIEGLDIVLKAWEGKPFTYAGQFWNIPNPTSVFPPVVQKPHPPVYVAAQTRDSFVWAGKHGYHVLMAAIFACRANRVGWIDDLESNLEVYDEALREAGHDPAKMERGLMIACHVGNNSAESDALYRPRLEWSLSGNTARRAELGATVETFTYDQLIAASGAAVGDAGEVTALLQDLTNRLGITELILEFNKAGLPLPEVKKSMKLFMSEVAPRIRNASVVPSEMAIAK